MAATAIVSLGGLALTALLAISGTRTPTEISPQGCRMSFMSPSYILQTGLDTSWTPLAGRYSLWLYREVGWDSNCKYCGQPVLFIPGNGGSFRQVRSIASSAARQFQSTPGRPNEELVQRGVKPLDFFAVHFNEDLTAFHGPTLAAQITYTSAALRYISSLYPPGTKIILMGHSMGGIVGVSQLPSDLVSTIFTMSTPHTIPPARFDSRIEKVYENTGEILKTDKTPILSICGGITDLQIPSESCNLPEINDDALDAVNSTTGLRKTVYSSALEGCWTGVGHNEMVWCHQVRWRVARAALEIGAIEALNPSGAEETEVEAKSMKEGVLEKWFRHGLEFPDTSSADEQVLDLNSITVSKEHLAEGSRLDVHRPVGERLYLLPIPRAKPPHELSDNFVLSLSQGTIYDVAPARPLPLSALVYICRRSQSESPTSCRTLQPTALRVIPNPSTYEPFPRPRVDGQPMSGGVDESEGVTVFEGNVPLLTDDEGEAWVVVWVKGANGNVKGWLRGGFEEEGVHEIDHGAYVLFYGTLNVMLNAEHVTRIWMKGIIEHALAVYRVTPTFTDNCKSFNSTPIMTPMMLHESSPSELHYYRLLPSLTSYIHSHQHAPFVPTTRSAWSPLHPARSGLRLTIYQHDDLDQCRLESISITLDVWRSLARVGARHWGTVIAWGGVLICWMGSWGWFSWDRGDAMPSPDQLLTLLCQHIRIPMAISLVPLILSLPPNSWLGNSYYRIFNLLAPIFIFVASGLVVTVWYSLRLSMWVYGRFLRIMGKTAQSPSRRGSIFSLLMMCALVLLVIPWQVEFLACYAILFHNCAIEFLRPQTPSPSAMALSSRTSLSRTPSPTSTSPTPSRVRSSVLSQQLFFLLSMTWVLPLVIPVVLVWFRTLATAGIFTHFDGDHFVFNVLGYMVLTGVVAVGRGDGEVFLRRQKFEIIPVPALYAIAGAVVLFTGPRYTYRMYDALNWPMVALLCCRVVPRLFARTSHPTRPHPGTET